MGKSFTTTTQGIIDALKEVLPEFLHNRYHYHLEDRACATSDFVVMSNVMRQRLDDLERHTFVAKSCNGCQYQFSGRCLSCFRQPFMDDGFTPKVSKIGWCNVKKCTACNYQLGTNAYCSVCLESHRNWCQTCCYDHANNKVCLECKLNPSMKYPDPKFKSMYIKKKV